MRPDLYISDAVYSYVLTLTGD